MALPTEARQYEPDAGTTVSTNVRRLREARKLSLAALAAASGVGKATLSRIETGHANPTIETLYALADALRVPLGDVVGTPSEPRGHLVRANEGHTVRGDVEVRVIDRLFGMGLVEMHELVFPAGRRREARPHAPGVVEHLLVTAGRLLAGPAADPAELEPGDLLRYPADVPHIYAAQGRQDARAIVLMAFPG